MLVILTMGLAFSVSAQTEIDRRYEGRYRLRGQVAHARQRVVGAIGEVVGEINPLFRALLEERLASRQPVATRVVIDFPEERNIHVRYEGERTRDYRSRAGYPEEIENEQGERVRLTQLFREGHLEQVFEGPRGRWYQVLTLSGDARVLTVATTITGERLPRPIRWQLEYERQER